MDNHDKLPDMTANSMQMPKVSKMWQFEWSELVTTCTTPSPKPSPTFILLTAFEKAFANFSYIPTTPKQELEDESIERWKNTQNLRGKNIKKERDRKKMKRKKGNNPKLHTSCFVSSYLDICLNYEINYLLMWFNYLQIFYRENSHFREKNKYCNMLTTLTYNYSYVQNAIRINKRSYNLHYLLNTFLDKYPVCTYTCLSTITEFSCKLQLYKM